MPYMGPARICMPVYSYSVPVDTPTGYQVGRILQSCISLPLDDDCRLKVSEAETSLATYAISLVIFTLQSGIDDATFNGDMTEAQAINAASILLEGRKMQMHRMEKLITQHLNEVAQASNCSTELEKVMQAIVRQFMASVKAEESNINGFTPIYEVKEQ